MLRSLGEMERVETMIMKRRLRWLGHLERMENSRIPKCFLVCRPVTGRRSAGGQKKRWCDVLVSDLKWCDLWDDWRKIAKDRLEEHGDAWSERQHQILMITRKHMRRRGRMRGRREERRALSQQHWTGSVKSLGVSLWGRPRLGWSTMSDRDTAVWPW